MALYSIQDGPRSLDGNSDDRDLFVVANDAGEALSMWWEHYSCKGEIPEAVFRVEGADSKTSRALDWENDVLPIRKITLQRIAERLCK